MIDASIYGRLIAVPDLSPSRQTEERQIRIVVRVNQSRGRSLRFVCFSKDTDIIRELSQLTIGERLHLSGELDIDVWLADDGEYVPSPSMWITSVG